MVKQRSRIGSRKIAPKREVLGQEERHRAQSGRAALSSATKVLRRGHPSRLPAGSPGSALTGPGRVTRAESITRKGQAAGGSRVAPAHTADMDRSARNQYLRDLREEYSLASKTDKTRLLDEAMRRTSLTRKVLIRKLRQPAQLAPPGPQSPRRRRTPAPPRRQPVLGLDAVAQLLSTHHAPPGENPRRRQTPPPLRPDGNALPSAAGFPSNQRPGPPSAPTPIRSAQPAQAHAGHPTKTEPTVSLAAPTRLRRPPQNQTASGAFVPDPTT
jgi:hypothetical protein